MSILCLIGGFLGLGCLTSGVSPEPVDSESGDTEQETEHDSDTGTIQDTEVYTDSLCASDDSFDQSQCRSTDKKEGDECVFYVDGAAPIGGDGLSWPTAFDSVQAGIDAAHCVALTLGACEVWVKEGDYYIHSGCEHDTVRLRSKVSLYGGFSGVEATIEDRDYANNVTRLLGIDGPKDSAAVFHVVTGADGALIDGFTIAKGRSREETWRRQDSTGAGLLTMNGSVKVANCIFSDNETVYPGAAVAQYGGEILIANTTFENNFGIIGGGAIYIEGSTAHVEESVFLHNLSNRFGGAIRSLGSTLTVVESWFKDNEAGSVGGALAAEGGVVTVENSVFENNQAYGYAGAVSLQNTDSSDLRNCNFGENRSFYGGAIVIDGRGDHYIENSLFSRNNATGSGGGMIIRDHAELFVSNSVFWGNNSGLHGGGILVAFTLEKAPVVANSILWQNTPDQVSTEYEGAVEVTFCDVQDGYDGTGNISGDPLFTDAENGDFSLLTGSPCIDAANGDFAPATDYSGQARVDIDQVENTGGGTPAYVDMGAYEHKLQ